MRGLEAVRAFLGRSEHSRKVFVIGSGRSGTHWLGHVLDSHPQIHATIEYRPIFRLVTRLATEPGQNEWRRYALLSLLYRLAHARVAPMYYADKSHPNIWLVDRLTRTFPDALFVGIQRNPYATVSSMLQHRGVRRWCEEWERYPIPNPFLGVSLENRDWYAGLSMAGRCAVRWVAHRDRLQDLAQRYPRKVLKVEHEQLILATDRELERLREHLGLAEGFPWPEVRRESLTKWSAHLAKRQIETIEEVTGVAAEDCI